MKKEKNEIEESLNEIRKAMEETTKKMIKHQIISLMYYY